MPLVSVIIPTYNRAYVVKRTIDSILNQTFPDFEIIVVDDGSKDDTKEVINSYIDNRIKYIYKSNGGVSSARNVGLKNATGGFICFLDSDDFWPENFLQVMSDKLTANSEYCAAYCMRTRLFEDGSMQPSYQKEFFASGQITELLFQKTFIQTSTLCFKKNVLDGLYFDETLTNGEDVDMWLKVSIRTKFLFVPDIQIIYSQQSSENKFSVRNCNRPRVLERFYFKLGGDKYVCRQTAMQKISNAWRSAAKKAFNSSCRKAAIDLAKKAISYQRWQFRLYIDLLKAYTLNRKNDKMPQWHMPEPLDMPKCYLNA
jgi:glycosyltransferase involved in cell wall biosynthesis